MILDSMSRQEVMKAIRKDFDEDVLPYYFSTLRPKLLIKIKGKASRLKTIVNLGWVEYMSKNRILYHILQRGDQYGDMPLFISEFTWRKRDGKKQTMFASLHPNSDIAIYTQHCLERYAERILEVNLSPKEIIKQILKKQSHAFHIVLPSPTHEYTLYHNFADALFLGDYTPPEDESAPSWNWYNTCISINEAGQSQSSIINCLCKLQSFWNDFNCYPENNPSQFPVFVKQHIKNDVDRNRLIEFLKIKYILLQTHLDYKFPFTNIFYMKISDTIKGITSQLNHLGESIDTLSPYDNDICVINKKELEYRQ